MEVIPLIRPKSNAHAVFPDQNYRVWDLVRAHNIWFKHDQRSLLSGDGLITRAEDFAQK